MHKIFGCSALLMCSAWPVAAQLTFGPEQLVSYSAAVRAKDIARGDLDGDGDVDLVSGSRTDGKIAAYLNLGGGSFAPQLVLDSASVEIYDVDVLDVEGDGDLDIVYAVFSNGRVMWLRNNGAGQFSPTAVMFQGAYTGAATAIDFADLDHDTDLDLLVIQYPGGVYSYYVQGPPGVFTFPGHTIWNVPSGGAIAIGDIDGDGWEDAVGGGNGVNWRSNEGIGFTGIATPQQALTETLTPITGVTDIVLSDLGGDGDPDILVASANADGIYYFINNGGGFFDQPELLASVPDISGMELTDVDGDGIDDLLVTSKEGNSVQSLGGNGSWFGGGGTPIAADVFGAEAACAADLNGDGLIDLAAVGALDDDVAWYPSVAPGQWDGARLLTEPAGLVRDALAADLDGDGWKDAVLALSGAHQLAWKKNLAGNFGALTIVDSAAKNMLHPFAIDLDSDGDLDLMTSLANDVMLWYANDGSGGFGARDTITTDLAPAIAFFPADLDSDGDADVVGYQGNFPLQALVWLENDGAGNFAAPQTIDANAGTCVLLTAADLDQDADIDVVIVQDGPDRVQWYENDGTGTFSTPQVVDNAINEPVAMKCGDVTGDGIVDLVYGKDNGTYIVMVPGNGMGGFGSRDTLVNTSGQLFGDLELADLDMDGDSDIVSNHYWDGQVLWIENDGTGSFTASHIIAPDFAWSGYVFVSDLNNDGLPDVLATSNRFDRVGWFENLGLNTSIQAHQPRTITAWPNPTANSASIAGLSVGSLWSVMDTHGRMCLQGRTNSLTFTIDLTGLAPGVYELLSRETPDTRSLMIVRQ
jgi:FG-GAP-like repeat